MWQLKLSMGSARALYKNQPFQVRGLSFIFNVHKCNTCKNILYMLLYNALKNTFSPLQVKTKPHEGDSEHVFILGSLTVELQANININVNVLYAVGAEQYTNKNRFHS
jgi:hypothetical protein